MTEQDATTEQDDGYTSVTKPSEVEALLNALSEPGGASLVMEDGDSRVLPVLVADQSFGEYLLLDISAIRELAKGLPHGQPFRLLGQAQGVMLRTPVLHLGGCQDRNGRLQGRCEYPYQLEVLQRREAFRARLRMGMDAGAILRHEEDGISVQGDLKDLSLDGCQLEMPLTSANLLSASVPLAVELHFPNGARLSIHGMPKHHRVDMERQVVNVGFQFTRSTIEQERQLWMFVREIERESARQSSAGNEGMLRSMLFRIDPKAPPAVARRNAQVYATAMTKRLARVAGYLDAQLLELRDHPQLHSAQLSRYSDRLLALYDEDREALLFATRCLFQEARLVRHGLSVAVALLDLTTGSKMPREICKAVAACAMVHDLGKGLLPEELLQAPQLDEQQRAELHGHVAHLAHGFETCQWLPSSVVKSVFKEINERLDGSGYPTGVSGDQLGELSRLAMVADVVDAMRRDRPDRPAWKSAAIYRHLLDHPERFDQRWVKRYIQTFGLLPIGTLVRYESSQLAWVQGLDEQGQPSQVQLTDAIKPPDNTLGEILHGEALLALGKPVEEVVLSL
jgi:c-di-GMP-binding flagellar brake protein YcgR